MVTASELPGLVDVSHEAHAAGSASGLRRWRARYPFGVVVEFAAPSFKVALMYAGDECLVLEDLNAAEVV